MSNRVKTVNIYEGFDKMGVNGLWLRCWNEPTGVINLRESHHSLSGQRWDQIIKRCKKFSVQQIRASSYKGVCNQFKDFQHFVEWSLLEYGYQMRDDVTGKFWSIDKDILGNTKVYSEDTCLFVPNKVNVFVSYVHRKDSSLPIGVYFNQERKKYIGQIKIEGKAVNLGASSCPHQAHKLWQARKVEQGYKLLDEFKEHHKLQYALDAKLQMILKDLENDRITTC